MCGSGAIAAALGARPGDVHGLDATAGEWAFGPPHSVLIQVPQANEAARWLAAKLGYREGFRGPQRMVEADMNDEELSIAKSTPSFQLIPGQEPVLAA